jgi:hypothetical protein
MRGITHRVPITATLEALDSFANYPSQRCELQRLNTTDSKCVRFL